MRREARRVSCGKHHMRVGEHGWELSSGKDQLMVF